ncbi:unnamed protein product, partial [Effrenium voratum]
MPLAQKPFKPNPEVELLRKECISFEDAAHMLENAVGCRKILNDSAYEILRARESLDVPGVSLVSFRSIEMAAKSLREDWTKWPKKLRLKRSPFLLVTGRLEINLHPFYLGNLGLGLRGAAGMLLHRWVSELQCIPLGFQELKPVSKHGAVVAASPFVHFYMQFKAVSFAPKKDDWLMGRVCEVQIEEGMNVTLVGLLNCHISAENLPKGLRFCPSTKRWLDVREGLPDLENGDVQGEQFERVYVKLLEDPQVDQVSSGTIEFRSRLGWPDEKMLKVLKKEQAAEKERLELERRINTDVLGNKGGEEERGREERLRTG